jgi:hypothetical protein
MIVHADKAGFALLRSISIVTILAHGVMVLEVAREMRLNDALVWAQNRCVLTIDNI